MKHTHTRTHAHRYTHTHSHTHTHRHSCMETRTFTPAHTQRHTHTRTRAHTHTHTHEHARARAHTHTQTSTRAHTHTHAHTQSLVNICSLWSVNNARRATCKIINHYLFSFIYELGFKHCGSGSELLLTYCINPYRTPRQHADKGAPSALWEQDKTVTAFWHFSSFV